MHELEKHIKVGTIVRDRIADFEPYIAPVIKVSGNWLRKLGFKSGKRVKVTASEQIIIIETTVS